jgi:hypothetical protein
MKRLNNIIDFTSKTDEYIYYYNKIYELTSQLDNCLRNRNFIINKFFQYSPFIFNAYKKDILEDLYDILISIKNEDILFDIEINKMIHTPWLLHGYLYSKKTRKFDNEVFEKYLHKVVIPERYYKTVWFYMLIKDKKKLNIIADKNSYKNYIKSI